MCPGDLAADCHFWEKNSFLCIFIAVSLRNKLHFYVVVNVVVMIF